MTSFRILCTELVEDVEEWMKGTDHYPPGSVELVNRARTVLAHHEPQGPTLDDISELCEEFEFHLDGNGEYNDDLESAEALWEICHAVLARWGSQ
jgi:hypothetical protein